MTPQCLFLTHAVTSTPAPKCWGRRGRRDLLELLEEGHPSSSCPCHTRRTLGRPTRLCGGVSVLWLWLSLPPLTFARLRWPRCVVLPFVGGTVCPAQLCGRSEVKLSSVCRASFVPPILRDSCTSQQLGGTCYHPSWMCRLKAIQPSAQGPFQCEAHVRVRGGVRSIITDEK